MPLPLVLYAKEAETGKNVFGSDRHAKGTSRDMRSENLSRPTAARSATSIRLTKVFSIEFHSLSCAMARSSHHLMEERFHPSAAVRCGHRLKFLLPATTPAEIQALRYCSLWCVCSRLGCFSRSHLATYTKKPTDLKRSPCKAHITSAANRCSMGQLKDGCSLSGKQLHWDEHLDRALAASSARSMRLTRVCVIREGNPFLKWQCEGL
jgi:hypothetical protein